VPARHVLVHVCVILVRPAHDDEEILMHAGVGTPMPMVTRRRGGGYA
jgi:hypothetical protein